MSSVDAKAAAICAGAPFLIGFDVPHMMCAEDMQWSGEAARLSTVGALLDAGVNQETVRDLVETAHGAGTERLIAAWWVFLRPLSTLSAHGQSRVGVLFEPASLLLEHGLMAWTYADIMATGDPWHGRRAAAREQLRRFRERLKAQAEGRS